MNQLRYGMGFAVAVTLAAAAARPMPFQDMDELVVLVLPVTADAFDDIERGIRATVGEEVTVEVLLATDYPGQTEALIAAAAGRRPALILPLGTTLCRAFLAASESRSLPPQICVAVTNAADVLSPEQIPPGRPVDVTIVPDGPESIYPRTADLAERLVPGLRRLGTIYSPSEANSLTNRERIAAEAANRGWQLIERTVSGPSDVEPVARALLATSPDAIWISKDRVMTGQPQRLIELAHQNGVPVFASDAGTVERFNALGTVSVSFEDLGRLVGRRVLAYLDGTPVSAMPVATVEDTHIFLSRPAIQRLSIEIPQAVADSAIYFGNVNITGSERPPARGAWGAVMALIVLAGGLVLAFFIGRRARGAR